MKTTLLISLVFISNFCLAQKQPEYRNLNDLFTVITKVKRSSDGSWAHRNILYRHAGLSTFPQTPADFQKLRLSWQSMADSAISNEGNIRFRNILQLALENKYDVLILDARRWGIDFNTVDTGTQQTLLDVADELVASASEAKAERIKEFIAILEEAGARRMSDIRTEMRFLFHSYDRIRPYAYGYYPVAKKDKWGIIDRHGNIIIPLHYKAIKRFTADVFEVSKDGKNYYFIDRKEKRIQI